MIILRHFRATSFEKGGLPNFAMLDQRTNQIQTRNPFQGGRGISLTDWDDNQRIYNHGHETKQMK